MKKKASSSMVATDQHLVRAIGVWLICLGTNPCLGAHDNSRLDSNLAASAAWYEEPPKKKVADVFRGCEHPPFSSMIFL